MSHVGWPQLLPLSLRLSTAQSLLASGTHLENYIADPLAKLLWDEFELVCAGQVASAGRQVRSEEEAEKEGPALDAFFQRVSVELIKRFGDRSNESESAKRLMKCFVETLGKKVCIHCANSTTHGDGAIICKWTRSNESSDREMLEKRGACLAAVKDVFEFSKRASISAYEEVMESYSANALSLSTAHGGMNNELSLAVNAYTTEDSMTPLVSRNVQLSFFIDAVSVEDYLSLLYLLMHECVAHGLCGVDIQDPAATLSVAFHEGWMDCVAASVVETSLADSSAPDLAQYSGSFIRQMQSLRGLRFNRKNPNRARDVERWCCGELAFHTCHMLFHRALKRSEKYGELGLEGIAREHLVAFSIELNASRVSHKERGELCSSINKLFSRPSTKHFEIALSSHSRVLDFIDDYIEHGDAAKLSTKIGRGLG